MTTSSSEPAYSSCSSVSLPPQGQPLPVPQLPLLASVLLPNTQQPNQIYQQNGKNGNTSNFSLRFILCFIFRSFLILLLFALIFTYFFNQAARLEQNANVPGEIRLSSLQSERGGSSIKMAEELARRRLFIKEMTRNAWSAYVYYAWGQDALEPETLSGYTGWLGPNGGLTLLQSMSTLWTMDFPEEFARGRQWIEEQFTLPQG